MRREDLGAILAVIVAAPVLLGLFCFAIEAACGFNPLWLLGAL